MSIEEMCFELLNTIFLLDKDAKLAHICHGKSIHGI